MSLAYQQQQQRRRQQQVVHHEPQQAVTPVRSATEAPELDERYADAGNSERAAMAGLDGGGEGQAAVPPPPGGMEACRAATAPPLVGAADLGVVLQQTEDFVLSLGVQAVDRMAHFEDASNRWYHFGAGQEQYEREKALYEGDVRLYQALGLRARADGAIVESVRRLVDEALLEAAATGSLLQGEGLAGQDEHGGLMLDPEDMQRDLALVEEAFAVTGYAAAEASSLDEIERAPGDLLVALEVQSHGLSASLAKMRARAVAIDAANVEAEISGVEEVIKTCDDLGQVMRLCAAGYRMGQGVATGELGKAADAGADVVDGPHELPGIIARVAYEDRLHALAGELEALTCSEEAWGELAHAEGIRKDLGEYTLAVHAIDDHQEHARTMRDDYVAELGNLGRTMETAALVRGYAPQGDVGRAMETLARIHATHRSLVGVEAPLQAAMDRSLTTRRVIGAASRARPEQAWLITLRQQLSGPAELYRSVHAGLEASQGLVAGQRGAFEDVSQRFGAIIQRQRR